MSAFPNREESLALQAALLDGDRAIAAWRELTVVSNPDGPGIAWIAPLLMHTVSRLLPQEPWVKEHPHFLTLCRLKGRGFTEDVQVTLSALAEAGVKTLALKGLALGASVYPWPGLRTVSDFDLLVRINDFSRAADALKRRGMREAPGAPNAPADFRGNHAHSFYPEKRHALSLDLHWHVLSSARGDHDDDPFWRDATPITIGTEPTLALCPEDQLLHVLVHGVRWTRMPHVRWVADAALVLRACGSRFRPERFLEGVERLDAVTPVQEGLNFLHALLGEGEDLLSRVRVMKRSAFARHAFKARSTSYEDRSVRDRIALRIESAVWDRRARRASKKPSV